ncbi:hypothetical protein [Actinacidiphila glaucinigra]|uniref:hypothetical protein n=1 Tax=Actinacidiphila glaucinigra TaxID=235986 RepID=UPI00386E7FC9
MIALRYLEGLGVEVTASLLNCSAGRSGGVRPRPCAPLPAPFPMPACRAGDPDARPGCAGRVRTGAARGGPGGRRVPRRRRT